MHCCRAAPGLDSILVSIMVCTNLHFALKGREVADPLSWRGFLQTLVIIAFCSFAIGLYRRFKFRSRYLAMELEEVRSLNEQLAKSKAIASEETDNTEPLTLTGSTSETVSIRMPNLLYIEAVGNYVKVYQSDGRGVHHTMIRSTISRIEDELKGYPMVVQCHRAFLVNLVQIERIESKPGGMQLTIYHCKESIPVSRSHISEIKTRIREAESRSGDYR